MAEEKKEVAFIEHNGKKISRDLYLEQLDAARSKYELDLKDAGYGPRKRKQALAEWDRGRDLIASGQMSIGDDGRFVALDGSWVNSLNGRDYVGMSTKYMKDTFDNMDKYKDPNQKFYKEANIQNFIKDKFFGGSDPTEELKQALYDSWRQNEYFSLADALSEYLTIHANDDFEGSSFSNADDFNNRMSAFIANLRDGNIDSNDINGASSIGLVWDNLTKSAKDLENDAEYKALHTDYNAEWEKNRRLELKKAGYTDELINSEIESEKQLRYNQNQSSIDAINIANNNKDIDRQWIEYANQHYGSGATPFVSSSFNVEKSPINDRDYDTYRRTHNFNPEDHILEWLKNPRANAKHLGRGLNYMVNKGSDKLVDAGNGDYIITDTVNFDDGTAYVYNKNKNTIRTISPRESEVLRKALEKQWRSSHQYQSEGNSGISWRKEGGILKFYDGGGMPTEELIIAAAQSGEISQEQAQAYLQQLQSLKLQYSSVTIPTGGSYQYDNSTDIWGRPTSSNQPTGLATQRLLEDLYKAQQLAALKQRAAKNGRTVEALKHGESKMTETPFTASDWIRVGNLVNDITSIGSSYIPIYGTAVAGVQGLTSMGADLVADAMDKNVSSGEMLSNLGANAAFAGLGMIPGGAGKIGKLWKTTKKLLPAALSAAGGIQMVSDPEVRKSFSKLMASGDANKLTMDDWKNIANGLKILAFAHNTNKAAALSFHTTLKNTRGPILGGITKGIRKFGEASIGSKLNMNLNKQLVLLRSLRDINPTVLPELFTHEINGKKFTGDKAAFDELFAASKGNDPSTSVQTKFEELVKAGRLTGEGLRTPGEKINAKLTEDDLATFETLLSKATGRDEMIKLLTDKGITPEQATKITDNYIASGKGTHAEKIADIKRNAEHAPLFTETIGEQGVVNLGLTNEQFGKNWLTSKYKNPLRGIEKIATESETPNRLIGDSDIAKANRRNYAQAMLLERQYATNNGLFSGLGNYFNNNWQMRNGMGPFRTRTDYLEARNTERNRAKDVAAKKELQTNKKISDLLSELKINDSDKLTYLNIAKRKYGLSNADDATVLQFIKDNNKSSEIALIIKNKSYKDAESKTFRQWINKEGKSIIHNAKKLKGSKLSMLELRLLYTNFKHNSKVIKNYISVNKIVDEADIQFLNSLKETSGRLSSKNIHSLLKADKASRTTSVPSPPSAPSSGTPAPTPPSTPKPTHTTSDTADLLSEFLDPHSVTNLDKWMDDHINAGFSITDLRDYLQKPSNRFKEFGVYKQGGKVNPLSKLRSFHLDSTEAFKKGGIIKAASGVKFSNGTGANWLQDIFNIYLDDIINRLKNAKDDSYANWLNDMLNKHANLYRSANASGNWLDNAYLSSDNSIRDYQIAYDNADDAGYNSMKPYNAIGHAASNGRYSINGTRTSGDWGSKGFTADNLYSAITDDRRILGRNGDWGEVGNENEAYRNFLNRLKDTGWEMYYDSPSLYYKLRKLNSSLNPNESTFTQGANPNGAFGTGINKTPWGYVKDAASNFNTNNLFEYGLPLASYLYGKNVNRLNEKDARVRPVLTQTFQTNPRITGDLGTEQFYNSLAAQHEHLAKHGKNSDATLNRLQAISARDLADKLREKGYLTDNEKRQETSDLAYKEQVANLERRTNNSNENTKAQFNALTANSILHAQRRQQDYENFKQLGAEISNKLATKNAQLQDYQLKKLLLEQPDLLENPEYRKAYNTYINTNDTNEQIKAEQIMKRMQREQNLALLKDARRIRGFKSGGDVEVKKAKVKQKDKELFLKSLKNSSDDTTKRQLHISKGVQKLILNALQSK